MVYSGGDEVWHELYKLRYYCAKVKTLEKKKKKRRNFMDTFYLFAQILFLLPNFINDKT